MAVIRILFFSDTHLGFDEPLRPRVDRRRRGPDFFGSCQKVVQTALELEVDAVVHGGDLFFRSRIPLQLAHRGLEILLQVAEAGIPVLLVPGNHERSQIPRSLLACHSRLLIFDRPRRFNVDLQDHTVEFAGFPFEPGDVRRRFPELLREIGPPTENCPAFLCLHQLIEGARVGPVGYTFRTGEQVIRGRDLPAGYTAVLAGHVHRSQVLTRDLLDRRLPVPVLYAGSTERTSFAEVDETKGFFLLEWDTRERRLNWSFNPLPVRPMVAIDVHPGPDESLVAGLEASLKALDPNCVVQASVPGPPGTGGLDAATLRRITPTGMNLELRWR